MAGKHGESVRDPEAVKQDWHPIIESGSELSDASAIGNRANVEATSRNPLVLSFRIAGIETSGSNALSGSCMIALVGKDGSQVVRSDVNVAFGKCELSIDVPVGYVTISQLTLAGARFDDPITAAVAPHLAEVPIVVECLDCVLLSALDQTTGESLTSIEAFIRPDPSAAHFDHPGNIADNGEIKASSGAFLLLKNVSHSNRYWIRSSSHAWRPVTLNTIPDSVAVQLPLGTSLNVVVIGQRPSGSTALTLSDDAQCRTPLTGRISLGQKRSITLESVPIGSVCGIIEVSSRGMGTATLGRAAITTEVGITGILEFLLEPSSLSTGSLAVVAEFSPQTEPTEVYLLLSEVGRPSKILQRLSLDQAAIISKDTAEWRFDKLQPAEYLVQVLPTVGLGMSTVRANEATSLFIDCGEIATVVVTASGLIEPSLVRNTKLSFIKIHERGRGISSVEVPIPSNSEGRWEFTTSTGQIDLVCRSAECGTRIEAFDVFPGRNELEIKLGNPIKLRLLLTNGSSDHFQGPDWWTAISAKHLDGEGTIQSVILVGSDAAPRASEATLLFTEPGRYSLTFPHSPGVDRLEPLEVVLAEGVTARLNLQFVKSQ